MNDHAIAKANRMPRLDRHAAVSTLVVQKIVKAEDICREEPVAARMPVCRVARIGRMVEDGDPQLLAVNLTEVVHPARAMSPDLRLAAAAFGIDHQPRAFRAGQ